MKARELIAELSKLDSEAEVVVGGTPIYFVEALPGYYDGSYAKLIQNKAKDPYYNIEGMSFSRSGTKIKLHLVDLEDMIWNCNDEEQLNKLKFEFEGMDEASKNFITQKIETIKQEFLNNLKEK